jgi:putative NIF3 family GTP cyclohydrolase 1 type 2
MTVKIEYTAYFPALNGEVTFCGHFESEKVFVEKMNRSVKGSHDGPRIEFSCCPSRFTHKVLGIIST